MPMTSGLHLNKVDSHAFCTTGYSPILNFQLKDNQDIHTQVSKLETEYGATLDGEVQVDDDFEIASLKSQDGHMVSLVKVKYDDKNFVKFSFYNTGSVNIQGATCSSFHDTYFSQWLASQTWEVFLLLPFFQKYLMNLNF